MNKLFSTLSIAAVLAALVVVGSLDATRAAEFRFAP